MKKSNIASFLAGAMIFGGVGVFAGQYVATENPFKVKLNGEDVHLSGYNIDGSTYFKLRDISSMVGGFNVDFWNNTIELSSGDYEYDHTLTSSVKYDNYDEFERLYAAQEYKISDLYICEDYSTVGMIEASGNQIDKIKEKIYDLANNVLTAYDSSYAISKDEIDNKCNSRYDDMIGVAQAEAEANGEMFWCGGTLDLFTSAGYSTEATTEILKEYYYELYKYTGEVNISFDE